MLPAQPKPTHAEAAISDDESSSVIELKTRTTKPEAGETIAIAHEPVGLVMTRPKPEKRKNAKERAKERNTDKPEAAEEAAVIPEVVGLATAHPKPAKRLNAKERAREKYTKDRTTPDTTAKAKSKVEPKKAKKSKSAAHKAA